MKPYRPQRLDHEQKFSQFMQWAKFASATPCDASFLTADAQYAVQLVKQVNYGPQESIRYFIPTNNNTKFVETTESDVIQANFKKLNSYGLLAS